MSSRTKVSKQVKVTQGKQVIVFELLSKGLLISYGETPTEITRFMLRKPAMDALRELLGMQQAHISVAKALSQRKSEDKLTLPPEEFDERFKQEQPGPPRESDGTPTSEGLSRKADGVEEGMGE